MPKGQKTLTMACTAALAGTLMAAIPASSFAAAPENAQVIGTAQKSSVESPADASAEFVACPTADLPVPKATDLGSNLGTGISEKLNAETLATVNASLVQAGKKPLPSNVVAMRYLNSGKIHALNAAGESVRTLGSSSTMTVRAGDRLNVAQPAGWLHPQVKKIIGACLGFGGAGGMGFEALVRYLSTPANAVKFVIRRIGIAGAISCVGGIIWLYI